MLDQIKYNHLLHVLIECGRTQSMSFIHHPAIHYIYTHLSSDDPWFRGPWFVRVKEVQHVPTKMFYEREVFMSNIQDTNPMRSIIRKCAVLFPTDYVKCKRVTVLLSLMSLFSLMLLFSLMSLLLL